MLNTGRRIINVNDDRALRWARRNHQSPTRAPLFQTSTLDLAVHPFGGVVHFCQVDRDTGDITTAIEFPAEVWRDMGSPDQITVTIAPKVES